MPQPIATGCADPSHRPSLLFCSNLPLKDAEERGATGRNGQGWSFQGRTGQDDPSNRYHKATKDEGSPKGHPPGCNFFSLVFFVQAKKSNSPLGAKPKPHLLEVEKTPKLLRPRRMPQFPQRLGLNLTNTLTRYIKLLTHLFQGVVSIHFNTKPHTQHLGFTGRQAFQYFRGRFTQPFRGSRFNR